MKNRRRRKPTAGTPYFTVFQTSSRKLEMHEQLQMTQNPRCKYPSFLNENNIHSLPC